MEVERALGILDATHKVPRNPGIPREEHRGFPAPPPLSPFSPPDLDRRVDTKSRGFLRDHFLCFSKRNLLPFRKRIIRIVYMLARSVAEVPRLIVSFEEFLRQFEGLFLILVVTTTLDRLRNQAIYCFSRNIRRVEIHSVHSDNHHEPFNFQVARSEEHTSEL